MHDHRGYFGIGIENAKTKVNIGTLWRSAYNFGAAFIFTVGRRYEKQASDTVKAWRHIPLHDYNTINDLIIPYSCMLIGVELTETAIPLPRFVHPERAIYLLGAEDHGLSRQVIDKCNVIIQIPSHQCLNVSVAGAIVMYDRLTKYKEKK